MKNQVSFGVCSACLYYDTDENSFFDDVLVRSQLLFSSLVVLVPLVIEVWLAVLADGSMVPIFDGTIRCRSNEL